MNLPCPVGLPHWSWAASPGDLTGQMLLQPGPERLRVGVALGNGSGEGCDVGAGFWSFPNLSPHTLFSHVHTCLVLWPLASACCPPLLPYLTCSSLLSTSLPSFHFFLSQEGKNLQHSVHMVLRGNIQPSVQHNVPNQCSPQDYSRWVNSRYIRNKRGSTVK